ncbi:MAG: hypothetical protein HQL31_14340, partial [Planctomycetes bacterium]|nr:hypothetical protein [Planctomycetota bacterium]
NRVRPESNSASFDEVGRAIGAEIVLALPEDEEVARLAEAGGNFHELKVDNPVVACLDGLIDRIAIPAGENP